MEVLKKLYLECISNVYYVHTVKIISLMMLVQLHATDTLASKSNVGI